MQTVGQMNLRKVRRTLMMQMVDREPALSLKADQSLTQFADLGLTLVVGSALQPLLYRHPVD